MGGAGSGNRTNHRKGTHVQVKSGIKKSTKSNFFKRWKKSGNLPSPPVSKSGRM